MRRPESFKQISRLLMDSWISSPDELADPRGIYGPLHGMLRANMVLLVIDTRSKNPEEFRLDFVKDYTLPTGLTDMSLLQRPGLFADFPDQHYLQRIVIPAYADAVERQRPVIGGIVTKILNMHVTYGRIILPQKNSGGRSSWCISLLDIRFLLPMGPRADGLDDSDLGIVQLLVEGASTREIADVMSLSARTIEHRIERLKSAFGARNIAHLVGLSISAGISGIGKRDD
ncbi:helix-turn-helix transcriptional regulator [Agrobacterium tumefaciens]|uniref:response regulator transcription factor n=1 Tax=Agrobacterium tumefaciens TaxID=358 RepID=UPI001571E078|nr:helix-turn-helix transcriptional regulator [Agrobacterium tumefaciens]NSZ00843.1 helix-turn-helix transcriptional regulator [Agrobacterium tumefaciens]NSZ37535.1 helix-turn-helix transcriptional regulator [Agrobacterium tumefaciens]NTB22173.1 helix-turn-helix transcriptional regulator [Agrobacterium tumefaciens]NTB31041.1 helix-turn-helix transcriptional regulator [Agrobacterium tumefaciens]NTB32453.1 helix-turn-helix transcriptional regulator [Agrobacterium tumefaciens]